MSQIAVILATMITWEATVMKRKSTEATEQEGHRLKALAALQGKSIEEFVLTSANGQAGDDGELALRELERLFDARVQRAKGEGFSDRTVEQIFDRAIEDAEPCSDA